MRRLIAQAGVASVALLISTGVFAQVTPNPDNPNDVIPDASTLPTYGPPINLETANARATMIWLGFLVQAGEVIPMKRRGHFG